MEAQPAWRKHLNATMDAIPGIRSIEFQHYEIPTGRGPRRARSMLTIFELALLYDLASERYRGLGQIVDLGPLLGVGTHALARGLAANRHVVQKTRRIYSFDLFLRENMGHYVDGAGEATGSVFDFFLDLNRDYLDMISVSPGDLLKLAWRGGPIEILFIDCAKSPQLNSFVLTQFFPHLIPGVSTLIQQDYVHFHEYWIAMTMELLREYFELVDLVFGSSAVYRLKKKLPPEALADACRPRSLSEQLELLDRAIARCQPSAREVLKCAKAYCLIEHNCDGEAASVLDSVQFDIGDQDPIRDFSGIARSNHAIVRDVLSKRLPR